MNINIVVFCLSLSLSIFPCFIFSLCLYIYIHILYTKTVELFLVQDVPFYVLKTGDFVVVVVLENLVLPAERNGLSDKTKT